jgi:Na+/H+ antiporter
VESVTIVLVLLVAVVISGIISRALPWPIPIPLVQIAFGALISLTSDQAIQLNPELFFLLFLPPLLFLDGWRIPKEDLLKDGSTVLELALGLVVFTVVGMGLFIHWMIPAMPLPVAFALAAVVSPTDPIAVSAIAQRVPIPKRLMHILEGESLLNDASGLVCLRFAIAATLTGTFSIYDASLTFLWLAFGGIAIGVGTTWIISRLKSWISSRYGEDTGSQILISLLIPFAAYLGAEHLHCSGILAAVAAGVTMSVVEASGSALAITRIRRNAVWDMVQFAANGIIFVLLGEQLPTIVRGAHEIVVVTGHSEIWWLAIYVVAINAGLAALRFAWVWVSFKLTIFRNGGGKTSPNWRIVAAMSLAGVRGAITLAGVLTLPLALYDGSDFPARDLAIFLAMGVIIISLIVASIGLPIFLRGLDAPPENSDRQQEYEARSAAAEAAIAEIDRFLHALPQGREHADMYIAAADRIADLYRHRLAGRSSQDLADADLGAYRNIEVELTLAAIKAERGEIFRRVRRRQLPSGVAEKLIRELDLSEVRFSK